MQVTKQVVVTSEGLQKLEEELEYLKTIKRKEVVETIKTALSFGDLSENSEYDEAKNEQAKVEVRIVEIEEILRNIKVINHDNISTDTIEVGSKVLVYEEATDEETEYMIVGSTEANPFEMKLSDESPVGRALIGKRKGDTVSVVTPSGEMKMVIKSIYK
ncbi:MAG: transcription elongation factor GreA [Eubacteriales bacterium]